MKKTLILFWLFISVLPVGFAQQFRYRAPLEKPAQTNFYRIKLPPEVTGRSNSSFSDLRIFGEKNREVPYFAERTEAVQHLKYFREYPIESKTGQPGAHTTLIIRNPNRNPINNISLLIKNTNVTKKASLSGSADGQNWFALENNYVLQSVNNTQETSEVKALSFPLSDYEFYRLVINDSAAAPLNILAAGYYDFRSENGAYTRLKELQFTRTDSAAQKRTYLRFTSPYPVLIDKLVLEMDSTVFFRRNAAVFEKKMVDVYTGRRSRKRHHQREELVPGQEFLLTSGSNNTISLNGFRSSGFYIVIENGDNPPLEIPAVKAYQLNTFLVAELKNGQAYELRFGNENLPAPTYDLAYFKDKIPKNLPELEVGNIAVLAEKPEAQSSRVNSLFRTKYLIWAALVLVLSLLGYMTYKMLQEQQPKQF